MIASITAHSNTYKKILDASNYIFIVVVKESVCLWVHTHAQYMYAYYIITSSVFSILLDTVGFESQDVVEDKSCCIWGNELLDATVVTCNRTDFITQLNLALKYVCMVASCAKFHSVMNVCIWIYNLYVCICVSNWVFVWFNI